LGTLLEEMVFVSMVKASQFRGLLIHAYNTFQDLTSAALMFLNLVLGHQPFGGVVGLVLYMQWKGKRIGSI
jgi:hypothetical protein